MDFPTKSWTTNAALLCTMGDLLWELYDADSQAAVAVTEWLYWYCWKFDIFLSGKYALHLVFSAKKNWQPDECTGETHQWIEQHNGCVWVSVCAAYWGITTTQWTIKNVPPNFCPYLHQILTNFKNSSTGTWKSVMKWLLNIPPHFNCIVTLPCEI